MSPDQLQTDHDLLIELRTEVRALRDELKEMRDNTVRRLEIVESNYVTRADFSERFKLVISKSEFWPVKSIVYGMATIILGTVITLLVSGVLKN